MVYFLHCHTSLGWMCPLWRRVRDGRLDRMHRWNPLFLVVLPMVVVASIMSTTPAGASAHSFPPTSTIYKGRIVAKNSDTHYFVLSFTCSLSGMTGSLSGGWTYE